jgi:hypothetical protein
MMIRLGHATDPFFYDPEAPMFQQLFTIGRNTFLESIRQPIYVVLILVGSLALILNPSLAAYTLEDDNKLLIDMGLSTLFIIGLLIAAFTATGVLNAEIENKTVLTVISKPISRPTFVVGKFLGVGFASAVAHFVLAIIFLLTVRHQVMQTASDKFDGPVLTFGLGAGFLALLVATLANYFYRRVFTSTFVYSILALLSLAYLLVLVIDPKWNFQAITHEFTKHENGIGQLSIGLVLVFEAILIMVAVAIATSTRLGQIMTLAICLGVFLLGLISEYALGLFADRYAVLQVLYWVTPNMQLLWPADALTQGNDFSARYVASVTGYTTMYVTAVLALAVSLFQTREVG